MDLPGLRQISPTNLYLRPKQVKTKLFDTFIDKIRTFFPMNIDESGRLLILQPKKLIL